VTINPDWQKVKIHVRAVQNKPIGTDLHLNKDPMTNTKQAGYLYTQN